MAKMAKTAVLQVADTGPLESLVVMLRAAGYDCLLPDARVRGALRAAGCDTVLDVEGLVRDWGYAPPFPDAPLGHAGPDEVARCDLFVDVKAHRSLPKILSAFPTLKGRVLWYRINGGKPEHVVKDGVDYGDEADPPCPVLTPNRWYAETWLPNEGHFGNTPAPWADRAYSFWPPFVRAADYSNPRPTRADQYRPPVCLTHNLAGWGYADLIEPVRRLGVRCHGVRSPDGLVPHARTPSLLRDALAFVHLKSSDAPGYALLEAVHAGCPVVAPRRLVWRNRTHDLFEEGVTYLAFDRETHDPLSPADVRECGREIGEALARLRDPAENRRVGDAARERLRWIAWDESRPADVASLREFLGRHFG